MLKPRDLGRTPPGVRELKHQWCRLSSECPCGRTPPGVRELKQDETRRDECEYSRTPPGVRELKLNSEHSTDTTSRSHPSRGA